MAISVNSTGVSHARSLISAGKVNDGAWDFSAEDGNKLLGNDNWGEYSKWFLATDSSADPKTKEHYKYPFGKGGEVYRRGLAAAESRAAAQGESGVASAAKSLFDSLAKREIDEPTELRIVDVTANFIRIRVRDPGEFVQDSFRNVTLSESQGIESVMGKLKSDPTGPMIIQDYMFKKDKWTTSEAEAWVKAHKRSAILTPEIRSLVVPELRYLEAERKLVGYAAPFNSLSEDLGGFKERIEQGAFAETIKHDDIKMLWDHNRSKVLARNKSGTLSLAEDSKGLGFEAVPPRGQWAKDLMESVQRGDVTGVSFGFNIKDGGQKWAMENGQKVRALKDVKLMEISITAFPAYTQSSISVRHLRTDSEDTFIVETNNGYFLFNEPVLSEIRNDFTERDKLFDQFDALSKKIQGK